ncbi:MAG: hypothetical protein ACYST6_02615 [Planctomycetota bacterium]|jgi:hypothetical protein
MAKAKRGLHKEISSIFDGVPLPKDHGMPQSPSAPAPAEQGHGGQSQHEKGQFELPAVVRPAAEEPKVSDVSKPAAPEESSPKVVSIDKPQGNLAVKGGARMFLENILDQIRAKVLAPKPGVDPRRQQVTAVLVPVLFVVFIVAFIKVLPGLKGSGPTAVQPPPPAAAAALGLEIKWEVPELYPQTLRDPMQFGSVTQQAGTGEGDTPGQLVVTAIVVSAENSTAVVGTEIVGVGDTIFGATVVKINPDSVEFEMDGKRWTARVQEQSTDY